METASCMSVPVVYQLLATWVTQARAETLKSLATALQPTWAAMSTEHQQLKASVAAMEAQWSLLGDAVVDAALARLHARLATLRTASAARPAQTLNSVRPCPQRLNRLDPP